MKNILFILIFISLTSCLGVKKLVEKKSISNETEKTQVIKDSISDREINREINNEYTIPLKSTDSLVNNRIREALQNFQAGAKSGGNSTRIVFDEDALAFKIASIVGQTQNTNTSTNKDTKVEKSTEEVVVETSKKIIKRIPFWIWLVVGLWFLPQIVSRLQILINPLSNLLNTQIKKRFNSDS